MEKQASQKIILIVDDDEFFIQFERSFLQREHFNILEARNGAEALTAMREQQPDLVLLDYYMPEMDGLEVLVRARAEGMINLPIIIVSKEENPAKIRELKESGATDFLTKPIEIEDLMSKVSSHLKESYRSGRRLPVAIKIRYRTLDELLSTESRDISTTGIFVRSKKKLDIGAVVELFLHPSDNPDAEPIKVMGEVVRTVQGRDSDAGAGLKFINLDPDSVEIITSLLDEERKRNKVDVMVVDDSEMIREMLRDGIVEAGWSVETCEDAIEALKALERVTPSLLLVDIMMPGMSGIEFCETFRKNARHERIPFIFVSSKVDKETVLAARESGATLFIAKPFDMSNILANVKQVLGKPGQSGADSAPDGE